MSALMSNRSGMRGGFFCISFGFSIFTVLNDLRPRVRRHVAAEPQPRRDWARDLTTDSYPALICNVLAFLPEIPT